MLPQLNNLFDCALNLCLFASAYMFKFIFRLLLLKLPTIADQLFGLLLLIIQVREDFHGEVAKSEEELRKVEVCQGGFQ